MYTKYVDEPETNDPIIKLFRNFCADEGGGEFLYNEKEFCTKDWEVLSVLLFVENNGSQSQYEEVLSMYQEHISQHSLFPFARSIRAYLWRHDKDWYHEHCGEFI